MSTEPAKVIDAAAGIVLPPKHLTELDRLASTVYSIDRSCSAVPKGCLKYTRRLFLCIFILLRPLSTLRTINLGIAAVVRDARGATMRAVRIEPADRVVSQDHPLKATCPQNGYTQ